MGPVNEQGLLEPHDRFSGHSFSSAGLRPQQGAAPEAFEVGLQFSCSPSGWVCSHLLGRQSMFVTCCYIPRDLCSLMCHVNFHILQLDRCLVDLIEKSFPCEDDFAILKVMHFITTEESLSSVPEVSFRGFSYVLFISLPCLLHTIWWLQIYDRVTTEVESVVY